MMNRPKREEFTEIDKDFHGIEFHMFNPMKYIQALEKYCDELENEIPKLIKPEKVKGCFTIRAQNKRVKTENAYCCGKCERSVDPFKDEYCSFCGCKIDWNRRDN